MKSIKAVATIIALAGVFSFAMYTIRSNQIVSVASVDSSGGAQTAPDRQLCERLIRFGQVAFDRGQLVEAKHFFQKAISVDPGYNLAWKKYDMALLALISAKVETDPSFLPDFTSDANIPPNEADQTPAGKTSTSKYEDDGC
jgi:Tfp pilus assembly protein PilF